MAKKKFDPALVSAALARGTAEVRDGGIRQPAPAPLPQPVAPARQKLEKTYLTVTITTELHNALYDYQLQYRKSNPRKDGLHPGIGGAVERLLRQALNLTPLEANHQVTVQ